MAININLLVDVNGSTVNTGFNQFNLTGLIMDKNPIIPYNDTQKVLRFNSAAQVGAFFGTTSTEATAANNYFKAYDGNLNIPSSLYFARYVDEDIAPYVRGGIPATLTALQAITSGAITLQFNGSQYTSTGSAVSTSTLPVDAVEWSDGTNTFVTVLNKTSATIGTYKLVTGALVLQGSTVATGTAPTGIAYSNIAGSHYVSVVNSTANTLGTYLWSGTAFALIGAAISTGASTTPTGIASLSIGSTPYLVVTNNNTDNFTTYSWTGSAFAIISGTPTVACGDAPTYITPVVINSINYVLIVNATDQSVGVFSWDGSKFVSAQTAIALGAAPKGIKAYTFNGFVYFTVCAGTNILTYIWTGTQFSSIGAGVTAGTLPTNLSYTQDAAGNDLLLVVDATANVLLTYIFNGATWVQKNSIATGTTPLAVVTYIANSIAYSTVINSAAATISSYSYIASGTALTGINLSSATSQSQVAAILQTAFINAGVAAATVIYDSTTQAFTFSNGDDSGAGTVDYSPVTALATALGITEVGGATLSQGSVALSATANLTGYTSVTRNWFTFTQLWDVTSDTTYTDILDFTEWVNNQNYGYTYVVWTKEANLKVPNNTNNVAYALVANGYATADAGQVTLSAPIMPNCGGLDLAMRIMGTAASVDYNAADGTLSFAYKTFTGVIPFVTTSEQFQAVLANGFNCYGDFDSRSDSYDLSQNGSMGGIYKWFDFVCNQIWLETDIQDSVITLFKNAPKVNNNSDGSTQIRSVITEIANLGLTNGTITVGNKFSKEQAALLRQQSGGHNVTNYLTQTGWYLLIPEPTPTQRANRTLSPSTFWYSNSGSINTLTINAILVF